MKNKVQKLISAVLLTFAVTGNAAPSELLKVRGQLNSTLTEFTELVGSMTDGGALSKSEGLQIQVRLESSQKGWSQYASNYCALSRSTSNCMVRKMTERIAELESQKVHLLSGE